MKHEDDFSRWQQFKDLIFLPLRILLPHQTVDKLGLTSVLRERLELCRRHTVGFALDIGAGRGNPFIRGYHPNGIGCEIRPHPGIDVVGDVHALPFRDQSFDTVLFIGSYLYFEDKVQALREARRVLRPEGRVILLTINPVFCWLRHKTAWWDHAENFHYPHDPLWSGTLHAQFNAAGLASSLCLRYLSGMAKMYVLTKGVAST